MNTGYRNTGDRNTGNRNTGDRNTGRMNTGNRNTGNRNTGSWNTGNCNTGNCNTGSWNTGNLNTGYFCEQDGPITFFDLPCSLTREQAVNAIPYVDLPIGVEWVPSSIMTDEEKAKNPNHVTIGGYLKKRDLPISEAFPPAWAEMDIGTKRRFIALPNFDAAKFARITGVDVTKDADLFPTEPKATESASPMFVEMGGKRYRLVPLETGE